MANLLKKQKSASNLCTLCLSLDFINFASEKNIRNYEPQKHNAAAAAHKGVHEKYK